MEAITFPVKTICWSQYEQNTPILLQEENGPCPLLAIVNTLLLKEDIEARTTRLDSVNADNGSMHKTQAIRNLLQSGDKNSVNMQDLINVLVDYLRTYSGLDPATIAVVESHLPALVSGLDVDLNLTDGTCSQEGLAHQLFEAFEIVFVHGWCREPDPRSIIDTVFNDLQTYDALQDFQLRESTEVAAEVQNWLLANGTQLTEYGLKKLDLVMSADLVSVFFRNNHFSTLYKGADHDFYLLITDREFSKHEKYVWQSLNSVSGGEDLFFTGDLLPIFEDSNPQETLTEDHEMAKMLQEREDEALATRMQRKLDRGRRTDEELAVKKKEKEKAQVAAPKQKEKKKKSLCIIM